MTDERKETKIEFWLGQLGLSLKNLWHSFRWYVAKAILYAAKPALAPMLAELHLDIKILRSAKVDWSDVAVKGDGTLVKLIVTSSEHERAKRLGL